MDPKSIFQRIRVHAAVLAALGEGLKRVAADADGTATATEVEYLVDVESEFHAEIHHRALMLAEMCASADAIGLLTALAVHSASMPKVLVAGQV
ncbi:hypothetical protein [Cypionkella psychrotolerans]|uniref:hypothetical protein n=1 Tax=Cypionkella psychrotolerans TaxID=1678131 RepID=UPI0006B518F4|nr:hypothetical protein [Cypionkella psychrotolerans]